MEEKKGLCAPIAPDCFSINSSVSLKTVKKVGEGIIIVGRENGEISKVFFFPHTRTWRGGVDTVEKKLSCVQNRGGQQLMAADFSLKTRGKRTQHRWICFKLGLIRKQNGQKCDIPKCTKLSQIHDIFLKIVIILIETQVTHDQQIYIYLIFVHF